MSETGELNAFREVTVSVELTLPPADMVIDVGDNATVKSALDGTVSAKV